MPSDLPESLNKALAEVLRFEGQERAERLAALIGEHPEVAVELRRRWKVLETTSGDTPADADSDGALRASPPERIGPYRILHELGEGGMGTVYLAEQEDPVRRQVAIKLVRRGLDSDAILRRFELERQALAVMNHDNIARVYDVGTSEHGQPYFVMEHVPGVPITDYCDQERLPVEERTELFRSVCAGVQHAHQKGVIHRDLKPSNVLVYSDQGRAVPKIIDFGIARAIDPTHVRQTMFTDHGQIIGTPEYMSPEQADPHVADTDTRTDVYALGVMLYEILVGELPFTRRELQERGFLEMQRMIREVEPPRPSTKLTTGEAVSSETAQRRRTTTGVLVRVMRNDLDWVVLKAMDKDPDRRYDTAAGLAADLGRFLAHEPLVAGPPSVAYRLRKFARRHRGRLGAAALVLISLLVAAVGLAESAAEKNRAAILRERTEAFEALAFVEHLEEARAAQEAFYPAWPEHVAAMRKWMRDSVGHLRAGVQRVGRTIEALAEAQLSDDSKAVLDRALRSWLEEMKEFEANVVPDVGQRLRWAERVDAVTLEAHAARWDAARSAIALADGVVASELYAEVPTDLAPQRGLVPIGMNPVTGLWEFYHLRSAWDLDSGVAPSELAIPEHDANGWIDVTEHTGIVFVLAPGGTFWMGAQAADSTAPNYDPQAIEQEGPVHEVSLAPFFVARHELTQAQWMRLTGFPNPSFYSTKRIPGALEHPVEQIDYFESERELARHRLLLPTEAQWEYACRGGTPTPWWTGYERESLIRDGLAVNGPDRNTMWDSAKDWPELDDGYVTHAPVDTMRANPWGLHHVHGNLWERCRDWAQAYTYEVAGEDGLRQVPPERSPGRVSRGGSFAHVVFKMRSSYRSHDDPTFSASVLGMRVSRAVQ